MRSLSPEAKQRIATLLTGVRFAFQWGFIPTVLVLGKSLGVGGLFKVLPLVTNNQIDRTTLENMVLVLVLVSATYNC